MIILLRDNYLYFAAYNICEFGKITNSHKYCMWLIPYLLEFCLATTGVCAFRCDNFGCRTFYFRVIIVANDSLGKAKSKKNDEFYTVFDYIQKEMNAYLECGRRFSLSLALSLLSLIIHHLSVSCYRFKRQILTSQSASVTALP